MPRDIFFDDIDSTAELPALDFHILSSRLHRTASATPLDSDGLKAAESTSPTNTDDSPAWHTTDNIAALQDEVATLKAVLTEEKNRYERLEARHQKLLTTLTEMAELIKSHDGKYAKLHEMAAQEIAQRQQRDQFIVRQAHKIKILREQLSSNISPLAPE